MKLSLASSRANAVSAKNRAIAHQNVHRSPLPFARIASKVGYFPLQTIHQSFSSSSHFFFFFSFFLDRHTLTSLEEGHEAITCENPRKIDRSGIDDVPGEVAWEQLRAAVADHDLDDVKEAAARYIKANPDATYVTLEKAFRSQNLSIYLIALEKELTSTLTNMDFQGNLDKKYTIQWRWSAKSARPKEAEGWPSPEENMERLGDAGEPVDRGIPRCTNCSQLGHSR